MNSEIPRAVHERGGYLTKSLVSKTIQHISLLSFDVGLVLCRRFPKDLHSDTGRAYFRSSMIEIRVKCCIRLQFDMY